MFYSLMSRVRLVLDLRFYLKDLLLLYFHFIVYYNEKSTIN